ncbi:MAG: osmotically inducible protein C [Flavobacteriales bacterium]|nr:osmotically inducible protein C [Flavobacteriales bacterium]
MKSKKIQFENRSGHKLSARIELPLEDQPLAFVIFAHCFTCNKDLTAVRNISRALSSEGIGVMLFDFTGLGESEGDFSETDFSSNISDLVSASDWLKREYDVDQYLIGHSLGGAAVLATAGKIEAVKAVVSIAAPFDPFHVSNLFKEHIDEIKAQGKAEVNIGGRPFKLSKEFIEDLKDQDPKKTIAELRKPLMVMHSPQDNIVSIKNAAKIYVAAMHPKNFLSLDGADHLLSNKSDSSYAGLMIAHWIKAQINTDSKRESEKEEDLEEGFVRSKTSDNGFATPIKTGNHHLLADEPTSVGGSDLGPSPYNLLAAALASCTSMTVQMYARRKEWKLEEVMVEIKHEKKHKEDCENEAKIDHFFKRIRLEGELDESQRKRLLEIAAKCPVHRTLEGDIQIESELMD